MTTITIMTTTTRIITAGSSTTTTRTCNRFAEERQAARSRQIFPVGAGSGAEGRPEHSAQQGHPRFKDDDERFVFQGVHMILDGDHQRPWKDGEKRDSRIVFIGRNLPGKKIRRRFRELRRVISRSPASRPSPWMRVARKSSCHDRHRSDTVSVVERTRAGRGGRPIVARAFSWPHRRCSCSARKRCCSPSRKASRGASAVHGGAILATAADGERIVSGGDDGKVVATDAKVSRDARDRPQASLDRSRRARAGRRGRLVGRQDRFRARQRSCANSKRHRRSADLPSCPRAFGSRSRITTARRSGFPTRRRPRRKSSNGKARISASPSAPTAAFSSPPCRSRCCTAGGSPTPSTCACPATRRA